jgi:hypothetical protein
VLAESGAEDREPPIDALGADAAMLPVAGRLANACAAERFTDQIRVTAFGDDLGDLGLGFPKEDLSPCVRPYEIW